MARWLVVRYLPNPYVVVGALAVIVVVSATVGTGIGAIDDTVDAGAGFLEDEAGGAGAFDAREVNTHFVVLLNDERRARGLSPVSYSSAMAEMGGSHSRYMKRANRIGHRGFGDGTIRERFSERGLLPECQFSAGGGGYYRGAENAGGAFVYRNMEASWSSEIYHITSEQELATYLFNSWLHSPGHRRPMMAPGLDEVGLGIAISSSNKVFAALEMCG